MKYRISKQVFSSAISTHLRKRAFFIYPIVIAGIGVVSLIRYGGDIGLILPMYFIGCLLLLCWGLIMHKFMVWRQSRQYNENAEFAEEMTAQIVNDELMLTTEKTKTSIPRNRIRKVIKTKDILMLYRTRYMFHIIPRSDDADFREIVNWLDRGRG